MCVARGRQASFNLWGPDAECPPVRALLLRPPRGGGVGKGAVSIVLIFILNGFAEI